MKNLITRTLTGIVYVGVMIGVFFIPKAPFVAIMMLFTLIGGQEFFKMWNATYPKISNYPFLCFTFFTFAPFIYCTAKLEIYIIAILILATFLAMVIKIFKRSEHPISEIAQSLFPIYWIAIPMLVLTYWQTQYSNTHTTILAALILIWLSDTFAYCGGSLFGKHKLIEHISPKKTWEGFLISLILTAIAGLAFAFIPFFDDPHFKILHWIGFAILINLSGTLGDLVESMVKRSAQVKDSGKFLPGHGGWLDRFDSILFAIPIGFIYWLICTSN